MQPWNWCCFDHMHSSRIFQVRIRMNQLHIRKRKFYRIKTVKFGDFDDDALVMQNPEKKYFYVFFREN